MEFEEILKKADDEEITKEEALYHFKETGRYDRALKLFEIAGQVRDDEIGNVFKLDGFMGLTTHCTVEPPCRYCWNSSTINISGFGPDNVLTIHEIVEGARLIEETEISGSIHGYRLRCERTRYIRIPSGTVSGWEVRT